MADMSDYADMIRAIIQEAQDELLEFEIDSGYLVITDGMDSEVIW